MFGKRIHPKTVTPETAQLQPQEEVVPVQEVVPVDDPATAEQRKKVANSFAGNHFIDGAMVGPVHARPGSFLDNGFFRR